MCIYFIIINSIEKLTFLHKKQKFLLWFLIRTS